MSIATLNANAAGNLFVEKCRNTHPLSSYEDCSINTNSGYGAYLCALDEATIRCRSAGNVDCVELGVTFKNIISNEFIGYKACEAKVTVRGWR
ncbi:MAG: hypothetical protein V4596_12570 [Bdellovibrionota bacterium]